MHRGLASTLALLTLALVPWSVALAEPHTGACPPGQKPMFSFSFARLQAHLGPVMGEPTECEHADPITGHTIQQTTTGLALYHPDTNTPMFTNGREHWSITPGGVEHWHGWHGSASLSGLSDSPVSDTPEIVFDNLVPVSTVSSVTILDVEEEGHQIVVYRETTRYIIEVHDRCATDHFQNNNVAFIISTHEDSEITAPLIVIPGGAECLIVDERAL